jgi:hypothetical protein
MNYRESLLWLVMGLLFVALFAHMAGENFVYARIAIEGQLSAAVDGTANVGRWMK